jgi:hypothetical protein
LGRGIGVLSCVAVAAILALAFAYGYDPLEPPEQPAKALNKQGENAAAGTTAAAAATVPPPRGASGAAAAGSAIEPAASAMAPEGAPHIAATLIAPAMPAPFAVTTATVARDESRGEVASELPDSPAVQIAALVPLAPAARRPAPATSPLPSAPLPWRAYAQPFDRGDKRPRLAIVVAGTDDNMDRAIDTLPPAVTLALDPYARRLPDWIELARAKGHEVLLTLSMPSIDHGRRDAEPMAILASIDPKENLERLDWALDRTSGFVGVLDLVAARPADETRTILSRLKQHGLMLVSATGATGGPPALPLAIGDAVLTPDMSWREQQQKLGALEAKVKRDGQALAVEIVRPENLGPLMAWLARLSDKSIVLAPATALIAAARDGGIARQ